MKLEHGLLIALACAGAGATAHNAYFAEGSVAVFASERADYPPKVLIFSQPAAEIFSRLISTPLDQGLQMRSGMKIMVSTPAANQIHWTVSADGEHLGSISVSIVPLKPAQTEVRIAVDIRETQFLGRAGIAGASDMALITEASHVILNAFARQQILNERSNITDELHRQFTGGRGELLQRKMQGYDAMMAERRRAYRAQFATEPPIEPKFEDPFQQYRDNTRTPGNAPFATDAAEAARSAAEHAQEVVDAAEAAAAATRSRVSASQYP